MKPRLENLVDLTQRRAAEAPDRLAFTYLADGEAEAQHLTYAQLDIKARAIAVQLQARGLAGERALLLYPPGLEFNAAFLGCLYAGLTAVPTYPPALTGKQNGRSLPRLLSIIGNAQPRVALTTARTLAAVERAFASDGGNAAGMEWIASDTVALEDADAWRPVRITAETLAFLQYTSGSTSEPKGVMLSHGNILHNQGLIARKFGLSEHTRLVTWLPVYHDMGLCNALFAPLFSNFRAVILPPTSFLLRPVRWLRAISDYEADVSGAPTFAYDLCVQRIRAMEAQTLNLSSWRLAFVGAEPVYGRTLARFAETFADSGFRRAAFYPCYGLAESTLFVTGGNLDAPPVVRSFDRLALTSGTARPPSGAETIELVGSGESEDSAVRIVDPHTRREAPPGSVGEIWVSSPSNGRGYWRLAAESQTTFAAYIADTFEGPFLRTGDLGFVEDGELFVTGRVKDIIIMYGANHYPQDIERTVERSHRALRWNANAAFATHAPEHERLVVVQELDPRARDVDQQDVVRSVRQAVAETHQIQVHSVVLIKPGTIYRTSSGKIQRSACKAGYLESALQTI